MRLNIIALGDVGQNLLLGLKLLGGEVIDEIGIHDINESLVERLEIEMGQIARAEIPTIDEEDGIVRKTKMPKVFAVSDEEILNCDVLVFCASRGVPPVGSEGDVRMAQLQANGELVRAFGERIQEKARLTEEIADDRAHIPSYGDRCIPSLILIMSDPVDQLCNIMLESSGLSPERIRGLGLGVMNARAIYYAERNPTFASYLKDGRVFGPHGKGLVVANSISEYDENLSLELTDLVVNANKEVRNLGYKPFIAPAISSGAL